MLFEMRSVCRTLIRYQIGRELWPEIHFNVESTTNLASFSECDSMTLITAESLAHASCPFTIKYLFLLLQHARSAAFTSQVARNRAMIGAGGVIPAFLHVKFEATR